MLERAAQSRIRVAAVDALDVAITEAEGEAKNLARTRLHKRTGYLSRSITGSVSESWPNVDVALRAGGEKAQVRYAALQEYGGTVTPKRGKFLAIHTGPALTGAGAPRYTSPRDVPGLAFVPIRGGRMGRLVKSEGKGSRARSTTWFLLVRSVTVDGKRYMRDPWESFERTVSARVQASFAGAMGVT